MYKDYFLNQFDTIARQFPYRSPEIPVGHPAVGQIGVCVPGIGFKIKGMTARTFSALMRDEERFRSSPEKMRRKIWNERGAITTWNEVLANRAGGKADDWMYIKTSFTSVAGAWSNYFRGSGHPPAGSYAGIPGGGTFNVNSTGAFYLRNPTGTDTKYLLNFGTNHGTGSNIILLLDLLVGAGNISTNTTATQTVNSTALTRYTDGVGVMMILDVTTALGATASNVTISYTNQNGTSGRSTDALAMTTSAITGRLQPTAGGALIPLQAGDTGVQSVQTITFSAAMGAGVVALVIYKPLLLIPSLVSTTYVERNVPSMLGGIIPLATDTGGNLGCLTVFVLTSTTATGTQTYFMQTVSG